MILPRKDRPRLSEGRVSFRGHYAELTRTQYLILERLVGEHPKLVRWQELYRTCVGREPNGKRDDLAKVHVYGLRKRLRDAGLEIEIVNRRQWGYKALW